MPESLLYEPEKAPRSKPVDFDTTRHSYEMPHEMTAAAPLQRDNLLSAHLEIARDAERSNLEQGFPPSPPLLS